MIEYNNGFGKDYSEDLIVSPLYRLDEDLCVIKDPKRLDDCFVHYLGNELDLEDEDTREIFNSLKNNGRITDDETLDVGLFDADDLATSLEEQYRIAVFSAVGPLYQQAYSADRYENWLPEVLEIAVPAEGRHQVDVCLREENCTDISCWMGVCPIKVIISETKQELESCDFGSVDYVIDKGKKRQNVLSLLSNVAKREYISEIDMHNLKNEYLRRYDQAFSSSK